MQKNSVGGREANDEGMQGFPCHDEVFSFDSERAEEPPEGSEHRSDKIWISRKLKKKSL